MHWVGPDDRCGPVFGPVVVLELCGVGGWHTDLPLSYLGAGIDVVWPKMPLPYVSDVSSCALR